MSEPTSSRAEPDGGPKPGAWQLADLSLSPDAAPEGELTRRLFLAARLVSAWTTRAMARPETDLGSRRMWIGRAHSLLLAAASGAPRAPPSCAAEPGWIGALTLEAIEKRAGEEPDAREAKAWLAMLPGYQLGALSQSESALENHGYCQMVLAPLFRAAWEVVDFYRGFPDEQWREAERWARASPLDPMSESGPALRAAIEREKAGWLARWESDRMSELAPATARHGASLRV